LPKSDKRNHDTEKQPSSSEVRTYRDFTLCPFQTEAVEAIDRGSSVLISAPTGAGKTLVAEYAIEKVRKAGGQAIYTAPIKALSNQKYRDFKELLGNDVGIMTGDITLNHDAPLLIMTTEIFRNTIFERPDSFKDVVYVVFDEIHFMDDQERGTVWEESIIFAPEHIQFICLSATVSNLKQFGAWISKVRGKEVEVIRERERPVPLKHYLYFPGYGPSRADKIVKFPAMKRGRRSKESREDLIPFLKRYHKLPVLYFCFSRKECQRRARENRRRNLLSADEKHKMAGLFKKVSQLYNLESNQSLQELQELAMAGVGYHHAGLLPQYKELVERLFTSGLLKLLFTTETFALGINMPARTVVFSSLRKFDGVGFDIMTTREYQQMAGRAGRQGIDDEGLVYSVIDNHRTSLKMIKKLISNDVEPVQSRFNLSYSSLINLHRRLGDKIYDAWVQSFNNFQWRRMSRKKREKNKEKQVALIRKKLLVLTDLEYINEDGLLSKGETAALINGYELQTAELLFSGLIDWMTETQLCIVFSAVVFEGRPRELYQPLHKKELDGLKGDVENCINKIIKVERYRGLKSTTRQPDFRIASVAKAWSEGASLSDLERFTSESPGDLIRTFRLTIQLLKQIRKVLPPNPTLSEKLNMCVNKMNRDEADAVRQLKV